MQGCLWLISVEMRSHLPPLNNTILTEILSFFIWKNAAVMTWVCHKLLSAEWQPPPLKSHFKMQHIPLLFTLTGAYSQREWGVHGPLCILSRRPHDFCSTLKIVLHWLILKVVTKTAKMVNKHKEIATVSMWTGYCMRRPFKQYTKQNTISNVTMPFYIIFRLSGVAVLHCADALLNNVTARAGKSFLMECELSVSSSSHPTISWQNKQHWHGLQGNKPQ